MAYPLILLSMVTAFLIVLFTFTVRQGTVVSDAFMNSADALIRKQDYLGLLAVCNRRNECIARITAKTLDFATRNPTASFEEVKEVTEAEGNRQSSLLLARIAYLGDVGAVAPMLGLLGTTLGMITTFHAISAKDYGGSSQLGLAQGVSEALLCTASGLVIGIPALIFYAIFRGKANRLISEMEAATTHLMALLAVQYKRAARAVASGRGPDGQPM
jgi:biopolymer transport protein ExbB